ncbi:penicillin-binding protein activator LpoB, partial [bacterium]|nr:penicillin-binding protein activator LpoB [bacterium]
MNYPKLLLICLLCAMVAVSGCSSKKRISRVDAGETIDLSGNWNDTDSRLVAEEMISDAQSRPWLANFLRDNGKNPAVIVGAI